MAGTLFVVATPLGNLGDLTPRAARVLGEVQVVVAEDTRRTRQLLNHLDLHPRLLSFHEHSSEGRTGQILDLLRNGDDLALVSDAGTPVVSDPGADLVRAAREAGFTVVPIPGVSAVTAALSVSGLPGDQYLFLGFPPRKGKARQEWLATALSAVYTVVCYEAPARLGDLLNDLASRAPARRAVVARELTKLHEEIVAGTLAELAGRFDGAEVRGEITLVMEGAEPVETPPDLTDLEIRARAMLAQGASPKDVVQQLVTETGLRKNLVYRVVMGLSAATGESGNSGSRE